jgi:tetratricopeptide (TPR) repeat protein
MSTDMNTDNLDQDELLHLAMEALRRNDHGAALTYLKDGAQRFPQNVSMAFLLGAEHAQIGMFDRAETEFKRALDIDPGLAIARFQLGLLQLTQARPDDAKLTWQGLDVLPEDHALRLFKQGLEALAEDRFDDARSFITKGMDANQVNPDLNRDMANVIANMPNAADAAQNASSAEAAPVWFNAYQNNDQTH